MRFTLSIFFFYFFFKLFNFYFLLQTQEIELLRKEVLSLREELNKLNNVPSHRVSSVTTWEKTCIRNILMDFNAI
jgi:hypothetical protein